MVSGTGSGSAPGDVESEPIEPQGTPEIASITPPASTSASTIETTTWMSMKKFEIKNLELSGLTNVAYSNVVATGNIRIITEGDEKGTIITNDKANSTDKLTMTLTGTYGGKSYTNNITMYVEPANTTTVIDKQGNEQEAFAIYNVSDLTRFEEITQNINPSANAALMRDIDLENVDFTNIGWYTTDDSLGNWAKWTDKTQEGPWGTYKGIFDGKNNKIKKFSYSGEEARTEAVGFFGGVQDAYIKNIVFENPLITTSNNSYVGILAGVVNNTTIEHIKVLNGSVTATGTCENIGGIVGGAYTNSEIRQCSNNATVTAINSSYVGGICGYIKESNIRECANKAQISGNQFIAGIVAQNENALVENTYNEGTIIPKTRVAGGICATISCVDTSKFAKIYNSYNKGTIQFDSNVSQDTIGGIVGTAFARGECKYCYNCADISTSNSNINKIGGIMGVNTALTYPSFQSNSNLSSKIEYCWNSGNVTSMGSEFGGIAGYNGSYCTIENSYITTNAKVFYGTDEITASTGSANTYRGKYVGNAVNAMTSGGTATVDKSIYQVLTEFTETSSIWTNETYPKLIWENM